MAYGSGKISANCDRIVEDPSDRDSSGLTAPVDIDYASKRLDLSTLETEALPLHSARVS